MGDTKEEKRIDVSIVEERQLAQADYERSLYEANCQLDGMSSQADRTDCFVAVGSGLLSGMLDVLWTGGFDLEEGRKIADKKITEFVVKMSNFLGCSSDDSQRAVAYLEKMFPIPSDGNTPEFGGGLQHHLRDFAHHPTLVGLMCSLLTQFTYCSYGTDKNGKFVAVPVPEKDGMFIGDNVPDKIFRGTVMWMFHLVSDVAGSSSTAGVSGGTGIPGPILALAKELSAVPVIRDATLNETSLSLFLSKLFNGTLFAERDENGKILKDTVVRVDLRAELGTTLELGKQAMSVLLNECVVRIFYFLRRLVVELHEKDVQTLDDFSHVEWDKIKPYANPTLTRMLTIATGVFTTVDLTAAVITKNYWVSVNYVGVGRFTVALGAEMVGILKTRDVKEIRQMYEQIQRNTFGQTDNKIYERIGQGMDFENFGLTLDQTEILYNIEWHKILNDIKHTSLPIGNDRIVALKKEWAEEWKEYITLGFSEFVGVDNAEIHWHDREEILQLAAENQPEKPWLRLVMLEAMLFEPYYALSLEKDEKGNDIPSKKYRELAIPFYGYKKAEGDEFLETYFIRDYYPYGYIKRLRKCYGKVLLELNEVLKTAIKGVSIAAVVAFFRHSF